MIILPSGALELEQVQLMDQVRAEMIVHYRPVVDFHKLFNIPIICDDVLGILSVQRFQYGQVPD